MFNILIKCTKSGKLKPVPVPYHKNRYCAVFEIPVVNQTQVDADEDVDEESEDRSINVVVTNERGMELLHLLRDTETIGPVRDVGPVSGKRGKASTDNLTEVGSEENGENQESRVSVSKVKALSSSGANGEREQASH